MGFLNRNVEAIPRGAPFRKQKAGELRATVSGPGRRAAAAVPEKWEASPLPFVDPVFFKFQKSRDSKRL